MAVKVTIRNPSTGQLEENAVLEVGAVVTGGDTQGTLPNVTLIDVITPVTLVDPHNLQIDSHGRVIAGDEGGSSNTTFQAAQSTGSTIATNKAVAASTTAGKVVLAQPDMTHLAVGFTTASILNNATGNIQTAGLLDGFSGLTPGSDYFITTNGAITATAPTTSSTVVQKVGIAITTTALEINIMPTGNLRASTADFGNANVLTMNSSGDFSEISVSTLLRTEYVSLQNNTGSTISQGKLVSLTTSNNMRLADSGSVNDYPVYGISAQNTTTGNSGLVQINGYNNAYSSLTAGALYFSDPSTPGGITTTATTTAGEKCQLVGVAVNSNVLLISIGQPVTKLAGSTNLLRLNGSGRVVEVATPSSGVTSVSGTSPVASSGGATPAISIAITTSNDGGAIVKQASYPGTQQTSSNINVAGSINAGTTYYKGGVEWLGQGTSFPGSPTNDQRYYRTDRNLEYYWDSTASLWLTINEYSHTLQKYSSNGVGIGNTTNVYIDTFDDLTYQMYLLRITNVNKVNTTHNSGAYWNNEFYQSHNGSDTLLVSVPTWQTGRAAAVYYGDTTAVNTAINTLNFMIVHRAIKTGAPGTMDMYGAAYVYRKIG